MCVWGWGARERRGDTPDTSHHNNREVARHTPKGSRLTWEMDAVIVHIALSVRDVRPGAPRPIRIVLPVTTHVPQLSTVPPRDLPHTCDGYPLPEILMVQHMSR